MGFKVAIVGATGNVGREMMTILEERLFPADEVVALASRRSVGVEVSYGDKTLKVKDLETYDFSGIDLVLMTAPEIVDFVRQLAALPGHPEIANVHNNLGSLYVKTGAFDKAAREHGIAVELRLASLGPEHPNTTSSQMGLGIALNKLGQRAEAERMLREAKASFTKSLGATHWRTANAQYQLGVVLRDDGRPAESLAEVRPAQEILLAELGPDHLRTVAATQTLAALEADAQAKIRTGP